ncbi:hypothetical protein [Kitasatospora sp. MBT63]|nr:hypothetical protein [Kitasatospora sp. MBT63]
MLGQLAGWQRPEATSRRRARLALLEAAARRQHGTLSAGVPADRPW